ncbi:MAG TPA: glycosyltransferase [Terriglobales bacterium]
MAPRSAQRSLICFSIINWDEVWEGPQEISSQFAAAGWRVLFVETIGLRTLRFSWSDAKRVAGRLQYVIARPEQRTEIPVGLTVQTPFVLPGQQSTWMRQQSRTILVQQIRRQLAKRDMNNPVVWTYNPSALIQEVCSELSPRLTVYCCVHDFPNISTSHSYLAEDERKLLTSADMVFVLSRQLLAKKRAIRADANLLPQGANLRHYVNSERRATEISSLPYPIIGYIGTIHEWVDQDLLKFAARERPDWTFVLIGPERVSTAKLRELRNIRLLSQRQHDLLPDYVATFDVGIIPYITSEFARTIRPNKVLEYLVMGKPVVSTFLPELDSFGQHISTPGTPGEFIAAIDRALTNDSSDKRQVRRELALEHSLNRGFAEIEQALLARL